METNEVTDKPSLKNARKKALADLRKQTNYPTFRAVVNVLSALSYLLATGAILAGFAFVADQDTARGAAAVISGLLSIIATTVIREALFMVADLTDSTLAANSNL